MSIGETIGADDLDLGPAITALRKREPTYSTAVEAVLPVGVQSGESVGDSAERIGHFHVCVGG